MTATPRAGVNYVPSKGWWYSWVDGDESAVAADLAAIAALGCDHIRIHCLWPLFQPNPNLVSPLMLARTGWLLDLADKAGLDVVVTVLNGWLSGFDFRPAWLQDGTSMFSDEGAMLAEQRLLTALAAAIGSHPRFLGFDVGNEPSVLATAAKNLTTLAEGDHWTRTMLAHCEAVAPGKLHSVGMDHVPWLTDEKPFSRAVLANTGALTPIHAWTFFTGALERYGDTATGMVYLARYLLELAAAFSDDPSRPVWLQEVGVSAGWLEHIEPADFVSLVLPTVLTMRTLWGFTWWCSHDISRDLGGFAELEYDLGLLTVHNVVKPAGARFREMVGAVRSGAFATDERPSTALVLPDSRTPDLTFADAWFHLVENTAAGRALPAIVLEHRAQDVAYLAQRGISGVARA
jgi:endo-1,4-beta-mannosidase